MTIRYICRSALVSVIRGIQKIVQKWPDDEPRVQSTREERIYRFTIASVWFVFTLLIALCVPDIGIVIAFLGGFAAAFMFLFPGLWCSLSLFFLNYYCAPAIGLRCANCIVFSDVSTSIRTKIEQNTDQIYLVFIQ